MKFFSQLAAGPQISNQQVVFALLVPSCWNTFGTSCNKLDGNVKVVLTTLMQTCCNTIVAKLTTQGCNNIVTS